MSSTTRLRRSSLRSALVLAGAFAFAPLAAAQVYKCVDSAGRTTYQQTPCPSTQKGSRVELKLDNGSSQEATEREASWTAAARSGELTPGMTKSWVQQALGPASDCRPGTVDDKGASEVCSFSTARGRLRTGLMNGAVVWSQREGTADTGTTTPDPAPADRPLNR